MADTALLIIDMRTTLSTTPTAHDLDACLALADRARAAEVPAVHQRRRIDTPDVHPPLTPQPDDVVLVADGHTTPEPSPSSSTQGARPRRSLEGQAQ